MKNKKILEISSYPPPRTGWGVRIEYVKKQLIEMGHDCKVLNIGKSRKIKSNEYIDVQGGKDFVFKVIKLVLKGYRCHMHLNGQSIKGFILSLMVIFINLIFGKRIFLTFHAGSNQPYFPRKNSRWFGPIFFVMFTLARKIICNHDSIKRLIMEYKISGMKINAIPAFSLQYLKHREVSLERNMETFIQNHDPLLSSYTLLRPTFYNETTIKVIKNLVKEYPTIGIVFMGCNTESDDMDPDKLLCLIKDLEIENHFFWAGDLSHDEFQTVLKKSTLFIRSYIYDGVCSSVLEALSLNIPVVACHNDLRPKDVILFRTDDESDLTKKIEYVLDNYNEIKSNIKQPNTKNTVLQEAELLIY